MRLGIAAVLLVACSGRSVQPTPQGPVAGGSAAPAVGSGSAPFVNPYPAKPVGPALAPVASAPGVKVTLGDVGLEPGSLDRSVDPCVDFYQFACGGWIANNEIPADRGRWGRAQQIEEKNRAALQALLEEAAKGSDPASKKLGDYYAACMDEAAIERAGVAPLKPLLDRTTRVGRDARSWLVAIAKLHAHGAWVLWRAETAPHPKDATTHAVYLHASAPAANTTDAYKAHVEKLLALAGRPKPEVAAADVLAIEAELAAIEPGGETVVDARQLARQTRSIDWRGYWRQLRVTPGKQLVVAAPKLFAGIDRLRVRFKPAQWASYFTYHAVAHGLDRSFEPTPPPRAVRCVAATREALGELLGQQYAGRHFVAQAKEPAAQLVDALLRALGDELVRAEWLADATKQVALAKLGKVERAIGHPDRPRSYDFDVERDDFAGNRLRAGAFAMRQELGRAGKPVDRSAWQVPAFAAAPHYDVRTNLLAVPAGALQPPLFGPDRAVAANLGGLGVAVARELVGGFDARGSKWDVDGKLATWWSQADVAALAKRAQCVETQYSGFEAMPKGFVDGKRTLTENIADHAGVKLAFKAYRALRKDAAKVYVADGYTEDQQFFIAAAQALCTRDRPEELAARLQHDPFAPAKFRVYGALRNMRELAEAFSCAPGTPMHPAKVCAVW